MENNNNEIKKYLLKQKPIASFMYIRQGHAYYETTIVIGIMADEVTGVSDLTQKVLFKIPVTDMGEADFLPEMAGQTLIRWIYG